MRIVRLSSEREVEEFAREAAEIFAADRLLATFAIRNPEQGELLAIRWGLGNDCVLVVRLDEEFEPTCYQGIIGGEI